MENRIEEDTTQQKIDNDMLPAAYPSSSIIPFPYGKPYPQQAALMDTLLQTLKLVDEIDDARPNEKRKANVQMLESPTGTGKSLSLACASIAWLKYRQELDLQLMLQAGSTSKEQEEQESEKKQDMHWLDAWQPQEEIDREKQIKMEKLDCYNRAKTTRAALDQELNRIRQSVDLDVNANLPNGHCSRKDKLKYTRSARETVVTRVIRSRMQQKNNHTNVSGQKRSRPAQKIQNNDFCVDEYESDENRNNSSVYNYDSDSDVDNELEYGTLSKTKKCMDSIKMKQCEKDLLDGGNLDGSGDTKKYEKATTVGPTIGNVTPSSGMRKIVYAARTHSQLSQFANEIRRTAWGDNIRVVTLGGRKLLCGNPDVTGSSDKRSERMITEKCLDLQKGKVSSSPEGKSREKSKCACPLLEKDLVPVLAMHMLAKPSDIEDLAALGKKSRVCSYYASREALKAAEVVLVPYNTLLSKPAREAVGLSLKNSLVIVDEAHNIPEALRSISSSRVSLAIIEGASSQLMSYVAKYSDRLTGRNLFYLGQIKRFLTQVTRYLKNLHRKSKKGKDVASKVMVTATELLFTLKLDNLNLFNIITYLERSRLSQKLHGFNDYLQKEKNSHHENFDDPNFVSKHISSMSIIESFLKCLTSSEKEGRVVIDAKTDEVSSCCLKYLLLDPSTEFQNVMDEAHSIVLAGGTLQPFVHVAAELFGSEKKLVAQAQGLESMQDGKEGKEGQALVTASLTTFSCGHVVSADNVLMSCMSTGPNGIKMNFRHSSRFENGICDELASIIIDVAKIVPNGMVVFLPSYSYESFLLTRWSTTGAIKEIELQKNIYREPKSAKDVEKTLRLYSKDATSSKKGAILFSVVGGKMSEGINFADEMARGVLIVGLPYPDITDPELKEKMSLLDRSSRENAGINGREYYQNLCMRAVNQSIGRAIRHANDYSAIMLIDERYSSDVSVWNGLPEWLRSKSKRTFESSLKNRSQLQEFYKNKEDNGRNCGLGR